MAIVEQPTVVAGTDTQTEQAEAPLSIMEHAAQFGPNATDDVVVEADLKPIRPVDQQRRDQGKFAPGQQRMRSSEAVKRINELTGRAKTAEERLAAVERERDDSRAELAKAKATGTPAQVERAEAKVERVEAKAATTSDFSEPEPTEDDPKFGGDYGKYLRAAAAWEGRKAFHEARQGEVREAQQREVAAAQHKTLETWSARITAAKAKYADFETVAFGKTTIPDGSPTDAFIMEDDAGADVLYYLQSHPEERDEILRLAPLPQLKRLSLLSQRLSSPPTAQAGSTGAASSRQSIITPPRPPTPVRTEAQRASEGPPPTDGTLSVTGHRKAFHRA